MTILLTALCFSLTAQSYNTVAGMRLGTDWGLTVKQRVYDNYTAELLVQSSLVREETMITVLAARHHNILTRHLNIYFGAGLHKGWVGEGTDPENPPDYGDSFGLDGIGGIEFTIGQVNVSYDIKPAVNLVGGEKRFYTQTGISLRYRLWKRNKLQWEKSKKRRERERRRRKKRRN